MPKKPSKLVISSIPRSVSARGPTSSQSWNDSLAEIVSDFAKIARLWNDSIVDLMASLPDGSLDATVNAFKNGLDGRTFSVDSSASGTDATKVRFYNSTARRPRTVKEQFDHAYSSIDSLLLKFQADLASVSNGLTGAQKIAIGMRIFDSTRVSSPTSLDGRTSANNLNLIQLGLDLYGSTGTLDGDGVANLANSIRSMLTALLSLHNGNWADDVTLSHSGAITDIPQTSVRATNSISDTDPLSGGSAHLEQDLNRIRTRLRQILGTATWLTNVAEPFSSSEATSLQGIVNLTGTGTKTSRNPWGYRWGDIDGVPTLENDLAALRTFVGMDSPSDLLPTYSSLNYVPQNANLEVAIGYLDSGLWRHKIGYSGYVHGELVPSGSEHWDRDVSLSLNSGIYTFSGLNTPSGLQLDRWIHHVEAPDGPTVAGLMFRRYEQSLQSGDLRVTVTHNRRSYPIVQAIFFDSGTYYSVEHTSNNAFIYSGQNAVVGSGLIIALW